VEVSASVLYVSAMTLDGYMDGPGEDTVENSEPARQSLGEIKATVQSTGVSE
jgi:hypothetical protein